MRNIFRYHQLRIARATLRMSDEGARIMGGMTKEEARIVVNAERLNDRKHNRRNKR